METGETSYFYLFASPTGNLCQSPATVFYKVETELLAESLCGLFRREYTDENGQPAFHFIPAAPISNVEQLLLDEALDWLPVYRDPDPGLYDPPPSEQTLFLAQYMIRAEAWEELLHRRTEHPSSMVSNDLRKLKKEVSAEVGAHPNEYKDAGIWLDEFCSEEQWQKRRKAEREIKREELRSLREKLKAIQNERQTLEKRLSDGANAKPSIDICELRADISRLNMNISSLGTEIHSLNRDIDELTEEIERAGEIPIGMRFSEAWHYWLNKYAGNQFVTAKDAKCIILISWLLLEPETEDIGRTITVYALWQWLPDEEDEEIISRSYAQHGLFSGEYADKWKLLTSSALEQVKLIERIEAARADGTGFAVIYIDLTQFSNVDSKNLLSDLIIDTNREGVVLNEKRHGRNQPRALRTVLNEHDLKSVAEHVKLRKGKVKLDIPIEKISTKQKK